MEKFFTKVMESNPDLNSDLKRITMYQNALVLVFTDPDFENMRNINRNVSKHGYKSRNDVLNEIRRNKAYQMKYRDQC